MKNKHLTPTELRERIEVIQSIKKNILLALVVVSSWAIVVCAVIYYW